MSFYCNIFRANFFDLKNSINRQNNGNLEPLKGFGINFFGSNHPLIYLNLSQKILNKGETPRNPKKSSLNSWQGSAKLQPLSPSPRPSEFCTVEDNIVNRSAMDVLRYSKNNYPSNCNRSFFIYFFQFDFGCTTYIKLFLCMQFLEAAHPLAPHPRQVLLSTKTYMICICTIYCLMYV